MKNLRKVTYLCLGLTALVACSSTEQKSENQSTLTIYSSRQEQLLTPLLEQYTEKTGVQFKLHTGKPAPLIQQLVTEGKDSPADIFMTVDAGNLWMATEKDLFQPVSSKVLERNIPSILKDSENRWFGFSMRARTIFFNPTKIKADQLNSFESLGGDQLKGKLCLRTSKKVYNQSLVASLIVHHGEKKAEEIVKSWVSNLATDVFSNDTELLKAIDSGQCAVGVANTYYYGRLMKQKPDLNVKIFWPNQDMGQANGVHVNVSGAGVLRSSKNVKAATQFLEWLSGSEAQEIFAGLNLEYPVLSGAEADPLVKSWGPFKIDSIALTELGKNQSSAIKLMERSQYR